MAESTLGQAGDQCRVEFRVRYAECDAFGYLHHAKYWEYFEHARTEQLRQNGIRYRDLGERNVFFVVYKAACKYIRPILYDDVVVVTVGTRKITRTRIDHAYEVHGDGELKCRAETTLACVGRDGRPILMPDLLWTGTRSTRNP